MNEHGFIRAVHRKLPDNIYRWKIHDTYAGGVPDAFYAGPARCLFVEYKYLPTLPKRKTTTIKTSLSPNQKHWLDRMLSLDQFVAVVIGSPAASIILINGAWHSDITLYTFSKYATSANNIATWITRTCTEQHNEYEEGIFSGCR